MSLFDLYSFGKEQLSKAGIAEADLDARLLLCEAYGLDTAAYLLRQREDAETEPKARQRFLSWIEARSKHKPLQYILGYTEFMGLRLSVDESVLIPRQDTETLCELVLREQHDRASSLLDLCCGSGAIAISLARMGGFHKVIGTDISERAVELSAANAGAVFSVSEKAAYDMAHKTGAEADVKAPYEVQTAVKAPSFYVSDMFCSMQQIMEKEGIDGFDIIVSNPPYIREEVIRGLEPEVRDHEPHIALSGGEDGLLFYRIIAKEAPLYLKRPGMLYLEIGYDQEEQVRDIFETAGFSEVSCIRDLCGMPRVIRAAYR